MKKLIQSQSLIAISLIALGCSGPPYKTSGDVGYYKDQHFGSGGAKVAPPMEAVEVTDTTSLEGVVKLNGDVSLDVKEFKDKLRDHPDGLRCLSAMASDAAKSPFEWVVDQSSKGVANVVFFIKPVDDKKNFFNIKSFLDKTTDAYPAQVVVDQPYCAFEPHVSVIFPYYIDPNNPGPRSKPNFVRTKQQAYVINQATVNHNTAYSSPSHGSEENVTLPAETTVEKGALELNQKSLTDENKILKVVRPLYSQPLKIGCSIHAWMQGYIWSLPHPFVAVTDQKGKFKIPHVPAGMRVRLIGWHEVKGVFFDEVVEFEKGKPAKRNFEITP